MTEAISLATHRMSLFPYINKTNTCFSQRKIPIKTNFQNVLEFCPVRCSFLQFGLSLIVAIILYQTGFL